MAIDVFSQREKFRQTLSRGGLAGAAVRVRTASRQVEREHQSTPLNQPVYPGMPLPKSATSKAVMVGGKWELHHSEPFVSSLNLNPQPSEGQELSLQGSPKRPSTNPVSKERQTKLEQESEKLRMLEEARKEAKAAGNVSLLKTLGLEFYDDVDSMTDPCIKLGNPGSRPATEYDSIRFIEQMREGLRSKGVLFGFYIHSLTIPTHIF